ncbi:MAG TPA: beta-ketoacyl reductase, partial [Methylomirabilota bacterium]|nr:beta-ketoacyl reductase [Methylomirabilota bacterium]
RALGLPALTVSWGAIGEVGYVVEHAGISRHFERLGLLPFALPQALAALEQLLRHDVAHAAAVNVDWAKWERSMPELSASSRFAHLARRGRDGDGARPAAAGSALDAVLAAAPETRPDVLAGVLRDQLAAVLGASPGRFRSDQPLAELGLDSLMAVELSCLIEDNLGVKPSAIELVQASSVAALAERLLGEIGAGGAVPPSAEDR